MNNVSFSALSASADSTAPTAVVCGTMHPVVDDLVAFFRNQSVTVFAEKKMVISSDMNYAVYVGQWSVVKEIIGSQQTAPKTLVVVIDGDAFVREIEIAASQPGLKIIIGRQSDVLRYPVAQFLSFLFSRGKHIKNITTVAVDAPVANTVLADREYTARSFLAGFLQKKQSKSHNTVSFPTQQRASSQKTRNVGAIVALLGCVIFVIIIYPVVLLTARSIQGVVALRRVQRAAFAAEYTKARNYSNTAVAAFAAASAEYRRISFLFAAANQQQLASIVARFLSAGSRLANAGVYLTDVAQRAVAVSTEMRSGIAVDTARLVEVVGTIGLADTDLAVAEAELRFLRGDSAALLLAFNKTVLIDETIEKIATLRYFTNVAKGLLAMAPEVVGADGAKTYLVLFQNNMELRPTGGFIGSFGTVIFEQGMMGELKIEDVYTADGQLKGHIDPPFAIRSILGQENWYLRDSNWDPDFAQSAKTAAWFLEKEVGTTVDGVVTIDLTAVAKLLEIIGPVQLADYNEEVSADNLFSIAQEHAQIDFFPGSTQKRDFLGALGKILLVRLFDGNTVNAAVLGKVVESLQQKHIVVYFENEALQEQIRSLGFAGTIAQEPCANAACYSDFLMLVDANLGVNKANYFVKRAVTDTIVMDRQGSITHTLTLLYRNSSPAGKTFPGGVYRNYLRVLVPQGAQVLGIMLDEAPVVMGKKEGFVASNTPTYFVDSYQDKTSIEVFFEVPTESDRRLTISYINAGSFPITNPDGVRYILTTQKQPGSQDDLFARSIQYPAFWQAIRSGSATNVAGASTLVRSGKLEYNDRLVTDTVTRIQFIK